MRGSVGRVSQSAGRGKEKKERNVFPHHPALWSAVLCCALSLCLQSALFPIHFSHQHYVKFIVNNYALIWVFGCTFQNISFTVYFSISKMCFYYFIFVVSRSKFLPHPCTHTTLKGHAVLSGSYQKPFESTFIHCMVILFTKLFLHNLSACAEQLSQKEPV